MTPATDAAPIAVTSWTAQIETQPPGPVPGGATFRFRVDLQLAGGRSDVLAIDSVDEFMAIAAVLQIPAGNLFFAPRGRILVRQT